MGIITLQEIMSTFPFSKARLVGGSAGVLRTVTSANIQEVPNVDRWLKGGEILFTAGYAFGSTENGCEMMKRLNSVGIAALAIKPGQYLQQIPQEMIDCADALGLPLFELPQDLPYMDCIIAIFEIITQEQLVVLRRAEKARDMLTETLLNQQGLVGICAILHRVTGSPVFITSPDGTFLASKALGERYDKLLDDLEDYLKRCKEHSLKRNQCNTITLSKGVKLMVVPVYIQDDHLAYLILDITNNDLVDVDMVAFEQASNMIAIEVLHKQALWQREQKVKEQLLEDLLMKRYGEEEMVIQRGRHLGFDITGRFCFFVIDADAFEEALKDDSLGLNEDKVQSIKAQVRQKIREGMNKYSRPSLILDSSVGALGMISMRQDADVYECCAVIDQILQELKKLPTNLTFSAGISRIKQGIRHVEQCKKEALIAMRVGRGMLHEKVMPHTHSFGELGCLCFLYELSDSEAMRDFYEENMRVLLDYDLYNNAELVKTLEYFFVHGQNLRKTADALFVHKNSVVYRLNKVKVLLDKDLDDHLVAFNLQLSLKLRNIF